MTTFTETGSGGTTMIMSDGTELPIIEFVLPIPGFSQMRRFVLVSMDESGLLYSLRSVDDEALRFLVLVPGQIFPDYQPEIDDATLALLNAAQPENLLVLLVVSAGESVVDSTANLLAPIVVDQVTRKAAQVVLSGTEMPIRAPLVSA